MKQKSNQWVPQKPNFGVPPPGYVAGFGRGAVGFVTRTDLGPAARTATVAPKQEQLDEAAYADSKYDSWSGYKGELFSKNQVDEQDRQAEDADDFCERRLEDRRLQQKEEKIKQQLDKQKQKASNTPISELFIDLKRDLAKVSEQEWGSIPESVTIKKQDKKQKYTPVPDSMLINYISSNNGVTKDHQEDQSRDYREAKVMLLKSNLDRAQNSQKRESKAKQIDKVGYLTSLGASKIDEQFIGDLQRARLLHRNALHNNPNNSDIWLFAARIEELDGKLQQCRSILRESLEHCPSSEDIWLQLSRVEKVEQSKTVLIEALRQLPKSEKIWLAAAKKEEKEGDKSITSKILRKGLENLPQSVRLWKQLIQLEDLEQAKRLLYKAVECLPKEMELWTGLAKLEDYENAKLVLNKARKANPLDLSVWICAAKLEQTQANVLGSEFDKRRSVQKIQAIIRKGRSTLQKNGKVLSREQWLQQALICERSGNLLTCESIVKCTASAGLTQEELNHSLFKDVQLFQKEYDSLFTTRFLFRYGVLATKNPRLLEKLIEFEQRLNLSKKKEAEVTKSMEFGLQVFPQHSGFWASIVQKFTQGQMYHDALELIERACANLQKEDCEEILLHKVKIYRLTDRTEDARSLLQELCCKYGPVVSISRSALQLVKLQYQQGNFDKAWELCSQLYKANLKQSSQHSESIWLVAIRIKMQIGSYEECKSLFEKATNSHPKCIPLWRLWVQFQLKYSFMSRARAVLDRALMKNPGNEELLLESIEMHLNLSHSNGQNTAENRKQISSIVSKAIKQCPKSGEIWAYAILLQPHNARKKKASVAIQQCGNCSPISLTIAKIFWKDNKIDKAQKWLEEAIKADCSNGDLWGYYYKLISQHSPKETERVLLEFRAVGKMSHGRKWAEIREQDSRYGWKLSEQEVLGRFMQSHLDINLPQLF